MAENVETAERLDLESFLSSVRLEGGVSEPTPMVSENLTELHEDVSEEERFVSAMAAMVYNMDTSSGKFDKQNIGDIVGRIDDLVEDQLHEILRADAFRDVEAAWTGLSDLVVNTNFQANIRLSLVDCSKDEALEDLELNVADISGSELFKKLYVSEYDQYGGAPFGGIVGLYEFANTPSDRQWLRAMSKIAAASHAPFIANVSPKFFGVDTMSELSGIRDLDGMMSLPKYSAWDALRETPEAAYIALAMPRYIAREPYNDETNPAKGIRFNERCSDDDADYLWAPASLLVARNLVRSFETSGWCQHIRGPKGGGQVKGLATNTISVRGEESLKLPVELAIPDFKELALSNSGFMPLVYKKGTAEAVFFSAQSIKKAPNFVDPIDAENAQLVSNISYTFSISRIAHYLKCIMRDNIGSTADAAYIKKEIDKWISGFVTTISNPDDLTLKYYPFKGYKLAVDPVPGKIGFYHCDLSILPHVQFEGMDVDLRVDASLGAAG